MTQTRERTAAPDLFRPRMWPDWLAGFEPLRHLIDAEEFRVEEYREGDTLVIRAELPGIDPDEDVEITVEGDLLRVHAQRREAEESTDKHVYRSEIRYGSFTRTVPLPPGAAADQVTATYADGILTVTLPVAGEPKAATKVPVTRR